MDCGIFVKVGLKTLKLHTILVKSRKFPEYIVVYRIDDT